MKLKAFACKVHLEVILGHLDQNPGKEKVLWRRWETVRIQGLREVMLSVCDPKSISQHCGLLSFQRPSYWLTISFCF